MFQQITGFVHRGGDAYAVYFAACHHHGDHEVWIDAIFSPSWGGDLHDRETFGCRVGPIEGLSEPAASLVDAAVAFGESAILGTKLTRAQALGHARLDDFWELVDHILVHDQVVRAHVYGPDASFEPTEHDV